MYAEVCHFLSFSHTHTKSYTVWQSRHKLLWWTLWWVGGIYTLLPSCPLLLESAEEKTHRRCAAAGSGSRSFLLISKRKRGKQQSPSQPATATITHQEPKDAKKTQHVQLVTRGRDIWLLSADVWHTQRNQKEIFNLTDDQLVENSMNISFPSVTMVHLQKILFLYRSHYCRKHAEYFSKEFK